MDASDAQAKYARLQHQVLLNIARGVRHELRRFGLAEHEIQGLTEELTFAAALAVEGLDVFDGSVLPVQPHVCFAGMGIGKDLLTGGGNPKMHEQARYAAEELFLLEP